MITVVSMSRRPALYEQFVQEMEKDLGSVIDEFVVFVNDIDHVKDYNALQSKHPKIRVQRADESFVMKYGHDTVYNYLDKSAKSEYILKLFDTDTPEVNLPVLLTELEQKADVYGMQTYMERGDVWEVKYQLYKKGVLEWYGLVHENQHFKVPNPKVVELKGLKIYHHNALDTDSTNLEKTPDGFIILKKAEVGSDSDKRNLLYETLTWKIVNESGRHDNPGWFRKHYQINKEIVDYYYKRAKEKFQGKL